MRLLVLAAGLLALSVVSAQAGWHEVETRFGALEVVRGKVVESVHFAGRPVSGPDGEMLQFRYGFEGVWQIGAEDVALIRGWGGGNSYCSNDYLIVTVSAAGARATAPFGRCAGEVIEVRVLATGLEIDLRATNPRFEHVAVTYSGGRLREANVPLSDIPAPLPGGGAAVTRWEGVHAHQMVRDPGERQRFMAIMSRDKLFELMDRMHVGGAAALKDGWLIAKGNMPHQGCVEMGGFAIEVATGRAEAVMFHKGRAPEVFGGRLGALHPTLQQLAHTGSPKCPAPSSQAP